MPRTKLNKKATNKRNRNSSVDKIRANAISEIDRGKLSGKKDRDFRLACKAKCVARHLIKC